MVMTDPVADMLTRIRNAKTVRRPVVDLPASQLKERIAKILEQEGYIDGVERAGSGSQEVLRVKLKYRGRKECAISGLRRISTPGRRVYAGAKELPTVMNGLGIAILSTPKGVFTDSECRRQRVGGEVLCYIW